MRLSRQRVIALLVLSCILLITLDARGSATIDKARNAFAQAVSPLQGVGRAVSNPVRNIWSGITHYSDLQRENDRLRGINDLLQGDAVAAQAAILQYQELAAQENLESLKDYSNVTCQVLAYGASNVRLTVEINKGSSSGIRPGMPVVNAAGLVGKVTQVSAHRSIVLLLTDTSYSVPVTISGTQAIPGTNEAVDSATTTTTPLSGVEVATTGGGTTVPDESGGIAVLPGPNVDPSVSGPNLPVDPNVPGDTTGDTVDPANSSIPTTTLVPTSTTVLDLSKLSQRETAGLEGRGEGKLPIARFVASDRNGRKIQVGDIVQTNGGTTAGLGSLAPAGLVVGKVSTVVERPGTAGPDIEVSPLADLDKLFFVRVVLYIPPTEIPGG